MSKRELIDLRSHEYLARELDTARERIAELEKALRWVRDGQDQGGSYIHAEDCNCVVCSLLSGETPMHERWDSGLEKRSYTREAQRIVELEEALREVLALAEASVEGDPWFAEDADMDAAAILARARRAMTPA